MLRRPLAPPLAAPRRTVRGRPLLLLAAVAALAVVALVIDRDDPAPGLSTRGVLTLVLAAVLVAVLTVRRVAVAGLAVALAVLLATAVARPQQPADPPAKAHAKPPAEASVLGAGCPELRQTVRWVTCLVDNAKAATDRLAKAHSPTTTKKGGR